MKKFIVLILLILPLSMKAQEIKIAIVNSLEVFNLMPETNAMEKEMAALVTMYQNQFKMLSDEYERKYSEFLLQQDSLTENIRTMRIQEIQEINTRAENFQQMFTQERDKKSQELIAPIHEKLKNTIEQVGEENGYTCIMETQSLLYFNKSTVIDATDKVKSKLGIR